MGNHIKTDSPNHRDYFEHQSESWDTNEAPERIRTMERIFSNFYPPSGGRILDVGSGTGVLVPIIHKIATGDLTLFEYDFSKSMLQKSKNKWPAYRSTTGYVSGDAEEIPFKDETFDQIICFAVLPHISDKHAAYREFYRTLATGGKLFILHLLSSERLNELHKKTSDVIAHDHLMPAESVAGRLEEFGFIKRHTSERDDLYLVIMQKPATSPGNN